MRFEFGGCHCKAGIPFSMRSTFKMDGPCRAEHRRHLKRAKTELTLTKKTNNISLMQTKGRGKKSGGERIQRAYILVFFVFRQNRI